MKSPHSETTLPKIFWSIANRVINKFSRKLLSFKIPTLKYDVISVPVSRRFRLVTLTRDETQPMNVVTKCIFCLLFFRSVDLTELETGATSESRMHELNSPDLYWEEFPVSTRVSRITKVNLLRTLMTCGVLRSYVGRKARKWGKLHINYFRWTRYDPKWKEVPIEGDHKAKKLKRNIRENFFIN